MSPIVERSSTSSKASPKVQVGPGRDDDKDLVVKRLKDAYGFEMPDACAKYLAHIHSTIGEEQTSPGKRNISYLVSG